MNDEINSFIQHYERLPVAVYLCDRKDLLLAYNTAAAGLLDVEPLIGHEDWYPSLTKFDQHGRLIDADYKPVTLEVRKQRHIIKNEIRVLMPDGEERYLLVSSVSIRGKDGQYDGAIHTLSDITDQRKSEKQQALLAAIVDSSDDAIIAKDLYGQITSWNRGAERIFGYKADEAVGSHIGIIIPGNRLAEEKKIIKAIRAGKMVEHFETIRRNKAGVIIPVWLTLSPIRDVGGRIVGASTVARDITKQKRSEEQIKIYTSHLEDMVAQRTAELDHALQAEKEVGQLKSRFVSMASHEFRTPLSAVKLSASLIEKYAQPSGDQRITKHVEKIKNAVNDLSGILGDFLSLEKLESGKVDVSNAEFNLDDFCRDIISEMQMLAKTGQDLIYRHFGMEKIVLLDQHLLKNCLTNLLSNAIKYSGEGTEVYLETNLSDNKCRVLVKDQGIGIPEADQQHLFSAFFRAGNTGSIQGTGLGLNIVARYVALMHGTVSFESHQGKGTCFILQFTQ